jgi:cyclomaltodextrinase
MNYAHFKDPVIDFFLKGSISQATFLQRLYLGLKSYPLCALHAMMNLLDSHDTWRINEIANGSIPNVKLIVLFQMTYIGTPHIYYGDEIGMQGAKDPDNRRPFNWQWQENPSAIDLHDYYKALIAVKKAHPVLQKGLIRFIRHPALLIFERFNVNNRLQIVINNYADNIEYTLPNPSSEIIFSTHPDACQSIGLITQLPAKSGIIILTD